MASITVCDRCKCRIEEKQTVRRLALRVDTTEVGAFNFLRSSHIFELCESCEADVMSTLGVGAADLEENDETK